MSAFSEQMDNLKSKLVELRDLIRDSEAYQELKTKYDELDGQTKFYINIGVIGAVALIILSSVFSGISKVNGLKRDINEREALIGYLQDAADNIKQLRAQSIQNQGADASAPLNTWVENVVASSNLDKSRVEVSAERTGVEDKESREVLVDIKLTQVNLRQVTRLLSNLAEQGKTRNLNIKDLTIDTKGDPTGYMDSTTTIAVYKAK